MFSLHRVFTCFHGGSLGNRKTLPATSASSLLCQAVPVQAHDPFHQSTHPTRLRSKRWHRHPAAPWRSTGSLGPGWGWTSKFPRENHRPWKILKSQSENCRESGLDSSLKKETGSGFGCCMMLRISAHRPISLSLSLADVHL